MKNSNPFTPNNKDKFEIWDLLIRKDFEAFLRQDWEAIAEDYEDDGFFGLDFKKTTDKSNWKLGYPNLQTYREAWIRESENFKKTTLNINPRYALYECCRLEHWEIVDGMCSVHKVFKGAIPLNGAETLLLNWRSIFLLKKYNSKWKIKGFVGYMNK